MEESKDSAGAAPDKGESYGEEVKSPIDKQTSVAAKTENMSNVSTQRASQVVNRFTSQTSGKNAEEIKEDIA